jgi:hypothetical protein
MDYLRIEPEYKLHHEQGRILFAPRLEVQDQSPGSGVEEMELPREHQLDNFLTSVNLGTPLNLPTISQFTNKSANRRFQP